ncbi:MAG: hypothetical protein GY749_49630 [Desulfobacteraceae bacterium]|nr:hypothetical protein [Desulfobacteraceae bacterium]
MDKTIYTQSIVHRLILYILLSSLLISLLITIFQLFLDYSKEMARIKAHMQQAKEFFLQTLPNNSENISHLKFRASLKKLLQPPDIIYLEVRSNGKTLDFAGNFQSEKTTSALFPIMCKHEDKNIKTGELLVIASLKPVYQRLEDKVWIILGSNAINTLLISVLIFFLFQFLVTRHLVRISQHTHVITPNHLDTSLILERKTKHDELQQVVEAINGMKINLRNSYKEFQNYLKNIQTSGQNLSELINNILDLSKIEAGKMELSEPLNIRTLIQSIYHINKAQALQKGISFQYDIDSGLPDIISSDRTKLNQILMNLTGNAIKFTPSGKEIRIRATKDDNQILFKVIDQGIGIPRDRQENIFGLFEQVDSTITRKFGGTGLGLAITKKMVMLLNGEIWLRSVPGKGSVFLPEFLC